MATPRVAAGALFVDDVGQVLLVNPTYKEGWDIPGGYVEPGETPAEACQREVKEELDLDMQFRRLLVVDWAPSESEGEKVLFIFDGGPMAPADAEQLSLPGSELAAVAFHPLDQLDRLMPSRLSRRICAAATARESGAVAYLEHGNTDWQVS